MTKPLRNIALYKEDGSFWTQEEYEKIALYFEDVHGMQLSKTDKIQKYIFDDGDFQYFMFPWDDQENNENFHNCKLYTFEGFFRDNEEEPEYSVPQVQFSFMKDKKE